MTRFLIKTFGNDKFMKNILIITGEPSGDIHAGKLIGELKKLASDISLWGIGGDRMQAEGVELIEHVSKLSIVGVWEALKKLPTIREQYNKVKSAVAERKPDLAILIDYPGFNLRVARHLNKLKIPVIYYIVPQFWAWGAGRKKLLKRFVDKALVIFKFEKELLDSSGIASEFVGHPLMDNISKTNDESRTTNNEFTIALLPGSRESEIQKILPVMLQSAEVIQREKHNVSFIVAESSNINSSLYDFLLKGHPDLNIERVMNNASGVLDRSDFAIVTSGTATLETAIAGITMIIIYRTSAFTATVSRLFMKIPDIGLANIVAGKRIVPELLQEDATGVNISQKALEIINNPRIFLETKNELLKVKRSLGEGNSSKRAAEAIYKFINSQS